MVESFVCRTGALVVACVALPTLAACLDHPVKPVEYESVSAKGTSVDFTINKDVDIIFMIDDSGSMAEEQVALAANFERFIAVLEADDVRANYRIGITTSDNGAPFGCDRKTPEAGRFVASSCRSRAQNFQFGSVDAFDVACASICDYDAIEIQPTTTENDAAPRPRPWIENIEGRTNLPEGISTTEAFQCFGPMGIAGCGFEEQLESVYKAIRRAEHADEDQYDFIRDDAILAIVLVSDEADGSFNRDPYGNAGPYDLEGNKVFWQDADATFPTSTVSWKAGVECSPTDGDGLPYDACYPQHYDIDGNVVPESEAATRAVLHPISRYIDLLQSYEDDKRRRNLDQEVLVSGILGVPVGYDGELTYRNDPTDPDFMHNFGIGPGCVSRLEVPGLDDDGKAVPPVRQKAVVEHFAVGDDVNLFSICDDDWSDALEAIAEKIRDQIKPACMPECVADMDPTTDALEPSCVLEQRTPAGARTPIPECLADESLPDGAAACYVVVTGDAMHENCRAGGWNLEFRLVRDPDQPAPGGTWVNATCELSAQPRIDCPGLYEEDA
jgi:hypothetical protein